MASMAGRNDELVSRLKEVVAALDAADVPADVREVAFGRAFDAIWGASQSDRAGRPRHEGDDRRNEEGPVTPSVARPTADKFSLIGKELEIEAELAERLFDEHGEDDLQFIGTLERFGTTKQAMVHGIAVLLCAARVAGGYDQDGRTQDRRIRTEVERHGLYDVTNYSKHTKQLRQLANVNGTGRSTTYKLKYEGRMRARELARLAVSDS